MYSCSCAFLASTHVYTEQGLQLWCSSMILSAVQALDGPLQMPPNYFMSGTPCIGVDLSTMGHIVCIGFLQVFAGIWSICGLSIIYNYNILNSRGPFVFPIFGPFLRLLFSILWILDGVHKPKEYALQPWCSTRRSIMLIMLIHFQRHESWIHSISRLVG